MIWFVNHFAFKCSVMISLSFFFKLQSRFGRFPGQCQSFKNFESQKNFARLAPQGSDRKLRAKRFVANFRSNKLEIDEQGFVKFVLKWLGKFKFSHELVDIVWKISRSRKWNTLAMKQVFWDHNLDKRDLGQNKSCESFESRESRESCESCELCDQIRSSSTVIAWGPLSFNNQRGNLGNGKSSDFQSRKNNFSEIFFPHFLARSNTFVRNHI